MIIEEITKQQLLDRKSTMLQLFDKYYAVVKDMVTSTMLYESLPKRLDNGALLLIWGEGTLPDGFLIADDIINQATGRKEGFIWTVYNPSPDFKEPVLEYVDMWAKRRELQAIVFMAENPLAFNKLVKDFGYSPTIGFFEKEVV